VTKGRCRGAHIHSILKKRLEKEESVDREYPSVWRSLTKLALFEIVAVCSY